jgi:hypothetical protein
MGCFDYECECGGTRCVYVGAQNGGDSDVIIEVPLNDGKTVYVKGRYESYGSVHVGEYQFYPEQFTDYFDSWLRYESDESRSKIFLAKRVWTVTYSKYNEDEDESYHSDTNCYPANIKIVTKLGKKTIAKCIRADLGLNILSDVERKKRQLYELQQRIRSLENEIERITNA